MEFLKDLMAVECIGWARGPLHSKWHEASTGQGMGQSAVFRESQLDERSLSLSMRSVIERRERKRYEESHFGSRVREWFGEHLVHSTRLSSSLISDRNFACSRDASQETSQEDGDGD